MYVLYVYACLCMCFYCLCAVISVLYHSIHLTYSTCGIPHRLMGLCSPMNCGWVWLSTARLLSFFLTLALWSTLQSCIVRQPLDLDLSLKRTLSTPYWNFFLNLQQLEQRMNEWMSRMWALNVITVALVILRHGYNSSWPLLTGIKRKPVVLCRSFALKASLII